ncbi:MAG: DNA recombination protein RmuC [Clostridia bacterium]|nr:DNA recombination protein RmuC [Clostridia bacterium]
MQIAILILSALTLLCAIITLIRSGGSSAGELTEILTANQREIGRMQSERFNEITRSINDMSASVDRRLDYIRRETNLQLEQLRKENASQLQTIQNTVDTKLQQTLDSRITKSFRLVNERLEQVYKGLGEMQTLSRGVGDLKKVFSNVKTRGILGEIQLGAILAEILAPEQYAENIATIPGSRNVVEFAIRLPDHDGSVTYMPIDSKFPADAYTSFLDAAESGNRDQIDTAVKALRQRLLGEAKDIHEKYVSPPYTTDFAIMFLPSEGLYAEAVNHGMIEELQARYKIMLAGPSTMAAMLSSIRMGFKTLAIEKRSAEVWEVLGAVKTEFNKFGAILENTQKRLNQANDELEKLVGARTRAIVRQLDAVERTEIIDDDEEI